MAVAPNKRLSRVNKEDKTEKVTDEVMNMVEEVDANEVNIVVDDIAEVNEEIGVTLDTTEIQKPVKLVRVKPKERFKCFIGEWYYFEAEKIQSVPEHVKETLMQRGKLLPM